MEDVPTCYTSGGGGGLNLHGRDYVPCYLNNTTTPFVPCCPLGQTCLADNLCQKIDSTLSVAYCTDPTYKDSAVCTSHCARFADPTVVYNTTTGYWSCCQDDCDNPSSETWNDTPPVASLSVLTHLAANYPATITEAALGLGLPLVSLGMTNRPAMTASLLAESVYPPYFPDTWYSLSIPSAVSSALVHAIATPTADLYTGPAPLRAAATSHPARVSASGMPIPTHSTSSKPSVIGPAIGGTLGGLALIALLLAFFLLRRRRKHRRAAVLAEKFSSPTASSKEAVPRSPAELESTFNSPELYSSPTSPPSSVMQHRQTMRGGHQYTSVQDTSVQEVQEEGNGAVELPAAPVMPHELDSGSRSGGR